MIIEMRADLLGETIVHPTSRPAIGDKPCQPKYPQVPGRVGLRKREKLLKVTDAELPMRKNREDAQTRFVLQGTEELGEWLCIKREHVHMRMSECNTRRSNRSANSLLCPRSDPVSPTVTSWKSTEHLRIRQVSCAKLLC